MPRMSSGEVRNDLMSAFEEYPLIAQRQGYVGLQLFPQLDVMVPTGRHRILPLEQVKKSGLTAADLARQVTGAYTSIDWKYENTDFDTQEYGLNVPLDDREQRLFTNSDNGELIATEMTRLTLLDALEKSIVDTATNASTYTGASLTAAVTASWKSAPTTAVPLTDIINAMEQVQTNTGIKPNAICLSWRDLMYLRECSTVLDRVKYSQRATPEDITVSDIADYLGLEKVIIANAFRNTGKIEAAASMSRFWPSGKIWVGITCEPNDNEKTLAAGRTYHYTEDGSVLTGLPEQYRSEELRRDVVRVRHEYQAKLVYTQCAFIITGAAA